MYERLKAGQIRLAWPIEHGAKYELDYFSADDLPMYVALSYRCGAAHERQGRPEGIQYTVNLDGQDTLTTENLHDALQYLSVKWQTYIWVDALCINQLDDDEKSIEVGRMTDIYRAATHVYCWLGIPQDAEESRLGIELMRKMNLWIRTKLEQNDGDIDRVLPLIPLQDDEFFPDPGNWCWTAWQGMAKLFNQDYWTRSWVYQETIHEMKTWVARGTDLSHEYEMSAAWAFANRYAQHATIDRELEDTVVHGSWRDLSVFRNGLSSEFKSMDTRMLTLLRQARLSFCTDPRDKVFAFRGLASDLAPSELVPDYRTSVVDVYTSVARHFLVKPYYGLSVLAFVSRLPEEPSTLHDVRSDHIDEPTPTWVPDWRLHISLNTWSDIGEDRYKRFGDIHYAAGLVDDSCITFEGRSMKVSGILVDRIDNVGRLWDDRDAGGMYGMKTVASWMPLQPHEDYVSCGSRGQAYCRTVTGGELGVHDLSAGTAGAALVAWLEKQEVRDLAHGLCYGRRLASTKQGYFGMLPAATKVGDTICIFLGAQVPSVVRAVNDVKYEFVGECYIHGIMNGEAFPADGSWRPKAECFTLV